MQEVLENIGLNKNETVVYGALLHSGEMTASRVAEKTGLTRTNSYAVLKTLLKKGIISEFSKKKKLTYQVEHPQTLLDFVKEKRQKEEEAYKELTLHMPKMIDDYEIVTSVPGASYLKGMNELKRVYDDILGAKKDVYVMASKYAREKKEVMRFMEEYLVKQGKAGIHSKAIVPMVSSSKKFDKSDKEYLDNAGKYKTEVKLFPPTFLLYSQVMVYGDAIAITNFKNQIVTTWIGDKDMAQTFRTIFMALWENNLGEQIT